jgi:TPR repeat protein
MTVQKKPHVKTYYFVILSFTYIGLFPSGVQASDLGSLGALNEFYGAAAGAVAEGPDFAIQNSDGQYEQGLRYAHGYGVRQNYARARTFFERAAQQGHADAQFYLATYYEHGRGGLRRHWRRARMLYEQAAAQGNDRALLRLELLYSHGCGCAIL